MGDPKLLSAVVPDAMLMTLPAGLRYAVSAADQEWAPTVASEFGNYAELHACSPLPIFRRTVMTMGTNLPIAILPGVVAELGRVFELLLRNSRAESAKRLVVSQGAPGNRIVAVAKTHETAKAHDGVGHASGQLVDDEVIDLTDIPALGSIDRGSVDVFARNSSMVWMSSCACHGIPPCNGLLPFNSITTGMFLKRSPDWTHGRCAISSHDENPAGFGKRISPFSGEWLHEIEHGGASRARH
jgi:hypothetical protein